MTPMDLSSACIFSYDVCEIENIADNRHGWIECLSLFKMHSATPTCNTVVPGRGGIRIADDHPVQPQG